MPPSPPYNPATRITTRPTIITFSGDDDPVRNIGEPPTLPSLNGSSYGIDSAALEGAGAYTPGLPAGSDTALGAGEGLTPGGTGRDVPYDVVRGKDNGGIGLVNASILAALPARPPPPSPPPPPVLSSGQCACPPAANDTDGAACIAGGGVPLQWYSRTRARVVGLQCGDAAAVTEASAGLPALTICWRRSCLTANGSLDNDDIEITATYAVLPAPFRSPGVGVALSVLRPSCASEAWVEAYATDEAVFYPLLLNEAATVLAPGELGGNSSGGGGLARYQAHVFAPRGCNDRAVVFLMNVVGPGTSAAAGPGWRRRRRGVLEAGPVVDGSGGLGARWRALIDGGTPAAAAAAAPGRCPLHAIPDFTVYGNADCPGGLALVTLEVVVANDSAAGTWRKDDAYATVRQCVPPPTYNLSSGVVSLSYCWTMGQLPDPFAMRPFRVRMTNVTQYNVRRMPGGSNWTLTVSTPAGSGATVQLRFRAAARNASDVLANGTAAGTQLTLPRAGIQGFDFEALLPAGGLDNQAVSATLTGPALPPTAAEQCACPDPLPPSGACPDATTRLTAWLPASPATTQRLCVPPPRWDGARGALSFSHCWRMACLGAPFQGRDYALDLDWTSKANMENIPAGRFALSWVKPKVVDMEIALRFLDPNSTLAPGAVARLYSTDGAGQRLAVPLGGVKEVWARIVVPYNTEYDATGGSVVLALDERRVRVPEPVLNATYLAAVNRTGAVMRSFIYLNSIVNNSVDSVVAVNETNANAKFGTRLSLFGTTYAMTADVAFPDFTFLRSCSPADVQAVLDNVTSLLYEKYGKYGVQDDMISASCRYNYVKPGVATSRPNATTASNATSNGTSNGTATALASPPPPPLARRARSLAQSSFAPSPSNASSNASTCTPRISLSITILLLNVPVEGNVSGVYDSASYIADAMYEALGGAACYVPVAAENRIGTMWVVSSNEPLLSCEMAFLAFANGNNLTAEAVRTHECHYYDLKKRYPPGLIVLWVLLGVVGIIVFTILAVLFATWRRRRAANLQSVHTSGTVRNLGGGGQPAARAVMGADPMGTGMSHHNDPGPHVRKNHRGIGLGEAVERPDSGARHWARHSAGGAGGTGGVGGPGGSRVLPAVEGAGAHGARGRSAGHER